MHRDDLCTAIGSCEHGYLVTSPLSLHDGKPREIHAYGIDSQGGTNPEIGVKTPTCAPQAPTGVRRKIDGAGTVDVWRFSTFWDVLPLSDAEADALPEGPSLKGAPELVKSVAIPSGGSRDTSMLWLAGAAILLARARVSRSQRALRSRLPRSPRFHR